MATILYHEEVIQAALRRWLDSPPGGSQAAQAMELLLSRTAQVPLTHLDRWELMIRGELDAAERRAQTSGWQVWRKPARFASWMDLCSHSGFERERFLRAVSGGAPNRFFFVLALRRLNDWVPQVRAAARARLPDLASHMATEHVVDAIWVSFPLSASWGRMEAADRAGLVGLLDIQEVAMALKSRIVSSTSGPVCSVLRQAGRTSALDPWLAEIARTAVMPAVRARACRCLLEARMTWTAGRKWVWTDLKWCKGRFEPVVEQRLLSVTRELGMQVEQASRDPSPLVRRVAGEMLIQHLDSVGREAASIARRLAADASPSVAERGRFALGRLGAVATP